MPDLAGNPGLRAVVVAARAWGVSPSRFLGRQPRRVTVHEFDGAGRVVRSVTTVEPEWTDEDRDLALALLAFEAQACPGCGGHQPETTDAATEGRWDVSALLCHRCAALGREQDKYAKNGSAPGAMVYGAKLREG